ncbi:MAG: DsrE family protein [Candidatus Thorarchaeota archaeon]|nr:DsrE family protein [Candidatus Thorarchaeota archaeon]
MAKLAFLVQTEPYKFEAIDTLLNMVRAAERAGHEILGVFFFGSGVHALHGHVDPGNNVRNIPQRLKEEIADKGIALIGCTAWLSMGGVWKEDRIDSVQEEGLGSLTELVCEADKLIFFGPGV